MKSRLYKQYKEQIAPALKQELGYKNLLQVPRLEKVVVNVGYGRNSKDKAFVDNVEKTLKEITGQNPVHNKAKKSISNFKIRAGMNVGCSVTLRGKRMYDFVDKLINVALPRVKDFRGLNKKSFDKKGNYSIGFREQLPFAEVKSDAVEKIHGLEVVIITSAKSVKEGNALLSALGFPFKK